VEAFRRHPSGRPSHGPLAGPETAAPSPRRVRTHGAGAGAGPAVTTTRWATRSMRDSVGVLPPTQSMGACAPLLANSMHSIPLHSTSADSVSSGMPPRVCTLRPHRTHAHHTQPRHACRTPAVLGQRGKGVGGGPEGVLGKR
jgi:hypothetical protein